MLAVFLVATSSLFGQEASGRVIGTVTDPTGAAVPGAKITVTNFATKVARDTVTDNQGNFQVLELPIGSYQVTVEHTGFSRVVTEPTPLEINQSLRIDVKMTVGTTTETVQVAAQAVGVETVNATLGTSVTTRPIVNLPLNGRNVLDLALLQPGVTPQRTNGGPNGLASIGGGRTDSVTFLLDGGVNNNLLDNSAVFNPNPDTVAEFRILTSNYTAEYGRNGGGIISVVTKSGTNEFHGSLFEFLRNDALNANTFFNNENGQPRPILKRNQFGVTVGGPLPKGKDRMFWFMGYQGQRLVDTELARGTNTYTPAELSGDFSRSNSARNGPDPNVVAYLQQFPFFQPNPALAAQGIIDPSRINTVANNYIKAGLIPTSPSGFLFPQGSGLDNRDELTEKLDFLVTQNDRISVTLGSARSTLTAPFTAASVAGYPVNTKNTRYYGSVDYTKVFTPNLLNDLRFTAQRRNTLQSVPATKLPTASQLGVGITPDNPTGPPNISFGSGLSIGFSVQGPTALINNTYVLNDVLTWTKGRHTLKGGFYFSPYQNNTVYDFYVNGNFFFSGPASSGGIGSGNDRADFLLGLPDEFLQFGQAPSNIRSKSYAGFFQDEWRAARNLTLTLGIRYEYNSPKVDTQGRSFSLLNGAQSTVFPNAPVGLLFPGDANAPKGANYPDKNDWAPRFGFAWSPGTSGKTSIRGGFGMFYDVLKGEDNLQYNGQAPFFGFADLFPDPLSANPTTQTNYFSDPFKATGSVNTFPSRPPAKNIDFGANGFLPFGGGGVYFVDPHLRTPYTFQYNLSVQHEFFHGLVSEIAYIGNSSHKLTALVDANPFILGTTKRLFNATPGNTSGSFSYLDLFCNCANSNYNGLTASLNKRLGSTKVGDMYFLLAYTYGHILDDASGFRERNSRVPYYNHHQFYASSDEDIRHRIAFSGGWDLGIDRGWESGPKLLTKGWSLYPIITYRTGFPLDVTAAISRSRTRTGPSAAGDPNLVRANLVGSSVITFDPHGFQNFNGKSGNYYFNPANFSTAAYSAAGFNPVANPSQRTYGTLGRNAFTGPSRTNADFAVAKNTPLFRDRVTSELRVEFFNIFNHAQFDQPSTTLTSSFFGQITSTADPRIIQVALRIRF
ncbi:MAG: carboxypeptidase regulatory-like domain-containing protein [Acidobacteriota bacterium]|nr:carboxypeptidase regulatory-like domain-containing protein [Acidobacteriota bacterium]